MIRYFAKIVDCEEKTLSKTFVELESTLDDFYVEALIEETLPIGQYARVYASEEF